jgi:hypothetical protein
VAVDDADDGVFRPSDECDRAGEARSAFGAEGSRHCFGGGWGMVNGRLKNMLAGFGCSGTKLVIVVPVCHSVFERRNWFISRSPSC